MTSDVTYTIYRMYFVSDLFIDVYPHQGAEEVPIERYVPSQLGAATVSSALSPDEALVVFSELQKARKCFVLESELHIIYQVL